MGWGPTARPGRRLPAEEARLLQALASVQDLLAELRPGLRPRRGLRRPRNRQGSAAGARPRLEALIVAAEPLKLTRVQKTAIQNLASERTRLKAEHQQIQKQLAELAQPARRRPGRAEGASRAQRDRAARAGPEAIARPGRPRRRPGGRAQPPGTGGAAGRRALSQLPLWTGTLDELDSASVPAGETLDRFEAEFADLEAQRDHQRAEPQPGGPGARRGRGGR